MSEGAARTRCLLRTLSARTDKSGEMSLLIRRAIHHRQDVYGDGVVLVLTVPMQMFWCLVDYLGGLDVVSTKLRRIVAFFKNLIGLIDSINFFEALGFVLCQKYLN